MNQIGEMFAIAMKPIAFESPNQSNIFRQRQFKVTQTQKVLSSGIAAERIVLIHFRRVKTSSSEKYVSCKFQLRFAGMVAVADINTKRKTF